MHYAMDDIEADYIVNAVEFVANHGYYFLPLYNFDMHTGAWLHKSDGVCLEGFSLEAALECRGYQSRALSTGERKHLYGAFLGEARELAAGLSDQQLPQEHRLEEELEHLKFFSVPESSVA
jgi:hypothetical protein